MKQQNKFILGLRLLRGAVAFSVVALMLLNGCKKDIKENKEESKKAVASVPADTLPCGNFRTQTQGGWGAVPHGNNPGTYLHANFAGAFPNGLTVGCNDSLLFTSAQAITDYLPDGGPAAVLTQSYVNPTNLKNVLAAQTVTLKLSVQFDIYDPNFGGSSTSLGNLIISSGTFAGMSVKDILAEANKVLGGCASIYTPTQMVDVITSINENFDDGTANNGFLKCPGTGPDAG
jgi:hypothetical protein